jgi:uncharacterized membrane protein
VGAITRRKSVVAVFVDHSYPRSLHPIHAVLLAGTVPLFLGVLLSEFAYASSYEVQWKNFASWLLVGGLVFAGFALLGALVAISTDQRGRRLTIYFLLLLTTWVLGFMNALIHAKDAWASMPEALILSGIVAVLAIAATVVAFSRVARESLR